MAESISTIPLGFCQCGCGGRTTIPMRTDRRQGRVRGVSMRYVSGHNPTATRKRLTVSPVDYVAEDRGYKSPCWIWQRGLDNKGYGQIIRSGKRIRAHVIYYRRYVDDVPTGMELDHLCRVPACCNPEHLEAVTHADNMRRAKNVKLSMEIAREIRRLRMSGLKNREIAARIGHPLYAVKNVLYHRLWSESA